MKNSESSLYLRALRISVVNIFFLIPLSVFSCDCPPLVPFNTSLSAQYDVIFYGKVDSVTPCNTKGFSTAWFSISALYKGEVARQVKVDFECQSDCLMTFVKEEEWLMYTRYQRFDLLKVSLCEHSRKYFADPERDIYYLSSQRSFEDEKKYLDEQLGTKPFIKKNEMNEQQSEMKPRNDQPSAMNKLWLLLISLAVMLIVFYFSRKKRS